MVRMVSRSLEIQYDPEADAAYIYVVGLGPGRTVARTKFCDVGLQGSAVILGLDATDGIVGIEILGASKVLPPNLLVESEQG